MIAGLSGAVDAFSAWLVSVVFFTVTIAGVSVNLIVLWLFAAMVFFTIWLGFPGVYGFSKAWRTLRGHYAPDGALGQISSFQALSTALSGTVGLGNIAGVALAIAMGGPGAAFWMIIIGFFAMNLKFAEVSIATRFRRQNADGTVTGGPMYYLSDGLAAQGWPTLGRILAASYACLALFAVVQVLQVNQSFAQVSNVIGFAETPVAAVIYGTVLAALAALVLIGGANRVASTTSRLVPAMCLAYLASCAAVLIINAADVPTAALVIIRDAFQAEAVEGGIIGVFVIGMRRAVYSNEAGIGAATIAHSIVKTNQPVSEGYVALMEPFVDTMIVCTATALVIVVTGAHRSGLSDIAMTSAAFATVSSWFPTMLAVAVVLFCFSTVIAAGFYARQVCLYLFGARRWVWYVYLALYCAALPIGAIANIGSILNIIDSFFFLLAVPNVVGLYCLARRIRSEKLAFEAVDRDMRLGRDAYSGPS